MNAPNGEREKADDMESLRQQASACGPECGCHAAAGPGRMRWVLGAVVLAAAAALAARAVMKGNAVSAGKTASGFAAGGIFSAANNAPAASDKAAGREISALSELDTFAADTNAVFVFLPDKKEKAGGVPMAPIQSAMRTIAAQGVKLGVFTLRPGCRDYDQITAQMAVPGVLAMVKGRGMSAVSGEITETKLVQAFVGASRAGGCGASAKSGCCPK